MPRLATRGRQALLVLVGLALVASLAPAALAKDTPNPGTIKVHNGATATPEIRNEPHVSCGFFVEGFGITESSGTLEFWRIPPTANPRVLALTQGWTADSGSNATGFHFNVGPITLSAGHYKVEAFVSSNTHDELKTKSKVFWVEPCTPPPCTQNCNPGGCTENCTPGGCTENCTPGPCTENCTPSGCTENCTPPPCTENCQPPPTTEIPVFPTPASAALAAIGGIAGYAVIRRRN
jgi:hypothetical protein